MFAELLVIHQHVFYCPVGCQCVRDGRFRQVRIICHIRSARSVELSVIALAIVQTQIEPVFKTVHKLHFGIRAVVSSKSLAVVRMLFANGFIQQRIQELVRRVQLDDFFPDAAVAIVRADGRIRLQDIIDRRAFFTFRFACLLYTSPSPRDTR